MPKRFRRPNMHTVGSFFSTDAGGRPSSHTQGFGQTEGVPWSSNIPGFEDFLGTISTMQVPSMGVFTPWGHMVEAPTAIGWTIAPLQGPPDTNILCFEFSQVAQLLASLGFGQPNFLAIVCTQPGAPNLVDQALLGTPYKLFDTGLAVYDQADPSGVPIMSFLYWIQLRDPGDPAGGASSVGSAAESIGGTLVFAQQVPVEQSTSRSPPVSNVTTVASVQYPAFFGGYSSAVPAQTTAAQEPAPAPAPAPGASSGSSMVGPIVIGIGGAVLGALLGRSLRKRRS